MTPLRLGEFTNRKWQTLLAQSSSTTLAQTMQSEENSVLKCYNSIELELEASLNDLNAMNNLLSIISDQGADKLVRWICLNLLQVSKRFLN